MANLTCFSESPQLLAYSVLSYLFGSPPGSGFPRDTDWALLPSWKSCLVEHLDLHEALGPV